MFFRPQWLKGDVEPQREGLSCLSSAHIDHDQKRAAEGYRPEGTAMVLRTAGVRQYKPGEFVVSGIG